MRAKVDWIKCVGCRTCVSICPEMFEIEGNRAVVRLDAVPKELEDCCRQAAEECPVVAIII
ncbi:MAG: ferredoxin [Armatimonadota bacterium]